MLNRSLDFTTRSVSEGRREITLVYASGNDEHILTEMELGGRQTSPTARTQRCAGGAIVGLWSGWICWRERGEM